MGALMGEKITLYGFNNLTKSSSFHIYDVCYAKSQQEQKDYIAYIDRQYNSERLTKILVSVTNMIGAIVLNISSQDYEPQGSSMIILIADNSKVPVGDTTVAYIVYAKEKGCSMTGPEDSGIEWLNVLKEDWM